MSSSSPPVRAEIRRQAITEICTRFGIELLYVFGSRAHQVQGWLEGEVDSLVGGTSDVDIGAKAPWHSPLNVREKVLLAIALEDRLDVGRVDLVCFEDADPFVAAEIIRGECLYAADPHHAAEYELYILRRAGDLVPLERERQALILGRKP